MTCVISYSLLHVHVCMYIYDSHILVTLNSGAFSPHLLYMTLLRMPAAHLPLPPQGVAFSFLLLHMSVYNERYKVNSKQTKITKTFLAC